eukprot:91786-Pelagomonas_calceolata.AAC.1
MLTCADDSSSKHSRSNTENAGMPVLTAEDYEQVPSQQQVGLQGSRFAPTLGVAQGGFWGGSVLLFAHECPAPHERRQPSCCHQCKRFNYSKAPNLGSIHSMHSTRRRPQPSTLRHSFSLFF